jgi:hypothetical protein
LVWMVDVERGRMDGARMADMIKGSNPGDGPIFNYDRFEEQGLLTDNN